MTDFIAEKKIYEDHQVRALLMPLTDIHLHSRNLREMDINGNINYIYLIIGANALLMIVVFFNLWLNAGLIFASNRRYYQILRLHGTQPSAVFKDETGSALILGMASILIGCLLAYYLSVFGYFSIPSSIYETGALSLIFLLFIVIISLIPALKGISLTQFLNTENDVKPIRFSYSNVRFMLIVKYAVVMIVVILAFGINKQINFVKNMQVGGNEQNIWVMSNQPDPIKEKYQLLKSELLKHKEIEDVTACMQLPGDAIRDHVNVKKEENDEGIWVPLIVAGEDFLPFFHIPLIAGRNFSCGKYDYQTEFAILLDRLREEKYSDYAEEYVINKKALSVLGFNTPEEAVGQTLHLQHGAVDYFNKGVIVGVSDDFNYTGLYEETDPLIILQRNIFLHCIMVRLNSGDLQQARTIFEEVWNEVIPDYPADYIFMKDLMHRLYYNEMNAKSLVNIFSLLCLIISDLGLIVFVAFIIRRRTKEIGIRKVHGASIGEILRMLNRNYVKYIVLAFAIAVPVAWYVMHRWLQQFAYRTALDWWIFALAGLSVLLLSVLSVSLQSWRAATANPVEAIKIE
jgi:putative ABC transport system permease protein